MPQKQTPPSGVPLTAAVPPLDKYWAVETAFARNAQRELDKHDFAAHLAAQADKSYQAASYQAGSYDDDEDDYEGPPKPYTINSDGVASLYLSGPLTKRPTSMSYFFGGTSTVMMRRAVRQAASDPDVKAIALIIDSPGGQVNGTADLAADVAAAAEKKPVGAYAEDTCCSAAYWIGSQADFLYCNPTAAVGSIGTLLVIEDTSGAYAEEGVKVHVVSTGLYKGAGADGSVITKAHLADFQREVDEINACFLQGVSDGRDKLSLEDVQALATGQVHIGQKAVDLGLCDAVTSLDEFLESLAMQVEALAGDADNPKDTDPDLPADEAEPDPNAPGAFNFVPVAETSVLPAADLPAAETSVSSSGDPPAATFPFANTKPADSKVGPEAAELLLAVSTTPTQETDTMPDEQIVPAPHATAPALPAAALSARTAVNNDILTACQAAGITSAKELADRFAMAKLGDRYAAEVREDAKVQAVRAYGADIGQGLAPSCDQLPVEHLAAMRDGWKAEADKKFGFGADGQAPARATAPAPQKVSIPAESGADAEQTSWDKLTAEQRKTGTQMGMNTPEKREKFAAQYLGEEETK